MRLGYGTWFSQSALCPVYMREPDTIQIQKKCEVSEPQHSSDPANQKGVVRQGVVCAEAHGVQTSQSSWLCFTGLSSMLHGR